MANSETGDGQAAGAGRGRSGSRSRRLLGTNAGDNGSGDDSTETLKESVEELQAQFRQVQQQLQEVLQLQRQATPSVSPAPLATGGQPGNGEAGAGPAADPNPPPKVTQARPQ